MAKYSYRRRVKERKSKRSAFVFIFLTISILIALFFYGIPALIRFAVFFADINQSSVVSDSQDTIAPTVPRTDPISEYTNERGLNINGYSESGAIVTMYYNSKNEETVANNEGEFRFKVNLQQGVNTFSFIAKDVSGNESPRSKTQKIVFDNTPPPLEIFSPLEGETIYGQDFKNLEIVGKTDPEIKVYADGRLSGSDEEGGFKIRVNLNEGENNVSIRAVDSAGNETETSFKINFYP